MREQCADFSVRLANEYMRGVREVEVQLRRQASKVTKEGIKLERERGYLDGMLQSLSRDIQVNMWSVKGRTMKPPTTEMVS